MMEQHFSGIAIMIWRPVDRRLDNLVVRIYHERVAVREYCILASLQKFHARFEKSRQPQIIRTKIGKVFATAALESFVESPGETSMRPGYKFAAKRAVFQSLPDKSQRFVNRAIVDND